LDLLREERGWIAVDKPPGVVVIPARAGDPGACLWRALERDRGERLWVVHRIDRDTSGVVLFARDPATHRVLCLAFERGEVVKTYLALTRGLPPEDVLRVTTPLHPARKGRMRPARPGEPGALESTTDVRVVRRWDTPAGPVALVEAQPRTGRQHQIRVHLRAVGSPLLIDPIYGGRAPSAGDLGLAGLVPCGRLTLHAVAVELRDPATGIPNRVESPLAADLAALEAALDRASGSR